MPKHFKIESKTEMGFEASSPVEHTPKWSSESLALFFGFWSIILALVCPGILLLIPFSTGANYCILVGFLLVLGFTLFWQRYRVLMLMRLLGKKLGGKKTFH